ncbi:DUF1003 domain-containing protein [Meiothermus granaticius]|uniref:DUF1003 domain-containing protein n=1 Tax=Meiothermus granaticius NBRC 107808 TaxID=1227551 RepID=A0A399FDY5_9DEIN|nr:DUF1003 domain-containing protein [Meiothermus granaticius]MCL6525713.1 DUF1003 domain-containing protein [Thermaceae bacterium]RIH93081.1 hypothetical protein Mgrana_01040 [Meiothermus granaticius NBRC 107808]GEM86644.1 hypothetical protein MGR01S_12690 [Meiothermus granaticius NBRC 107808]
MEHLPSIEELLKHRQPPQNPNLEHQKSLSALERLALWITEHVGSMGFFIIILVWTIVWMAWNFLAPPQLKFDPPWAFAFWLFLSNMIQLFLMPLIMIGQNLQGRHAELRAEHDFEINIKAEREIGALLQHIEFQNNLLLALVIKSGLTADEALKLAQSQEGHRQIADPR